MLHLLPGHFTVTLDLDTLDLDTLGLVIQDLVDSDTLVFIDFIKKQLSQLFFLFL